MFNPRQCLSLDALRKEVLLVGDLQLVSMAEGSSLSAAV